VDSNREHIYPFSARPDGLGRNSLKTPSNVNFDLRMLRLVPFWRGHLDIVAESFNLLKRQNVDTVQNVFGTGTSARQGSGQRIQAAAPRRIQFSPDFEY
jgi:hypothetical protein